MESDESERRGGALSGAAVVMLACLAAPWRIGLRWHRRMEERRLLAHLDEHMLRDIGIDPAQVWQELGKRFWEP